MKQPVHEPRILPDEIEGLQYHFLRISRFKVTPQTSAPEFHDLRSSERSGFLIVQGIFKPGDLIDELSDPRVKIFTVQIVVG